MALDMPSVAECYGVPKTSVVRGDSTRAPVQRSGQRNFLLLATRSSCQHLVRIAMVTRVALVAFASVAMPDVRGASRPQVATCSARSSSMNAEAGVSATNALCSTPRTMVSRGRAATVAFVAMSMMYGSSTIHLGGALVMVCTRQTSRHQNLMFALSQTHVS